MNEPKTYELEIGGKTHTIQHGILANQANGSVTVRLGDTVVLVTATRADAREGIDFFPLTIDYDERLYRHKMETAAPLFNDLHRLQNFIAVTGDYVAAEATAERFLDVLGRLEKEVLGEVRHRVPREALVRIAPPIGLETRYEDYRKD